jgi:hypothetical protein
MSKSYEPALPTERQDQCGNTLQRFEGLTKREFFAAMALQGILAAGSGGEKDLKVAAAADFADLLLEELAE